MKIRILTASALINQDTGRTAGLYEEVNVPRDRADYLISVGAAEALDGHQTDDDDGGAEEDQTPSPKPHAAPADGATTTEETNPVTGEPVADQKDTPAPAKAPAPAPAPVRRPMPKTK